MALHRPTTTHCINDHASFLRETRDNIIYYILYQLNIKFLPARRYASVGNSDRNVSVRPSVTRR